MKACIGYRCTATAMIKAMVTWQSPSLYGSGLGLAKTSSSSPTTNLQLAVLNCNFQLQLQMIDQYG